MTLKRSSESGNSEGWGVTGVTFFNVENRELKKFEARVCTTGLETVFSVPAEYTQRRTEAVMRISDCEN
jgi:hypothetical protein